MPRNTTADSSLKSRSTSRFNPSVEKKLLAYTALASSSGVGILALAQPAEARIIYTPTHQTIAVNTSLSLDLNGDGITDFIFSAFSTHGPKAETFTTNSSVDMRAYGLVQSNQIWGGPEKRGIDTVYAVSALPAGAKLGPKGKFAPSNMWMGIVGATDGNPPSYFGPWAPQGGNQKNKYVGLKFVINGEVHFGWARFSVQMRQPRHGGLQALLTGYAYETVANAPIITGKTSGPEDAETGPATLGKLALGSARQ